MSYHEKMKKERCFYSFSAEKNRQLITERGISFEEIIASLEKGNILDVLEHPNPEKYPQQRVYIVEMNRYVYAVPFVRKNDQEIFLKTAFPTRKLTRKYLGKKEDYRDEQESFN